MTERVLGDIATSVLFENDRVRVWEMRLDPGERSAIHEHKLDYVMIQVSGDTMAAEMEPDSGGPWGHLGTVEGDIASGQRHLCGARQDRSGLQQREACLSTRSWWN